jgi:hypothetical protein
MYRNESIERCQGGMCTVVELQRRCYRVARLKNAEFSCTNGRLIYTRPFSVV